MGGFNGPEECFHFFIEKQVSLLYILTHMVGAALSREFIAHEWAPAEISTMFG